MSEKSEWRKALREPNAMGWIAFFVLVVAIGAATMIFGSAPEPKGAKPASATPPSRGRCGGEVLYRNWRCFT